MTMSAIVLAAGQGVRMRSRLPKVLHPLAGRAMLDHVLDALQRAMGVERRLHRCLRAEEAGHESVAEPLDDPTLAREHCRLDRHPDLSQQLERRRIAGLVRLEDNPTCAFGQPKTTPPPIILHLHIAGRGAARVDVKDGAGPRSVRPRAARRGPSPAQPRPARRAGASRAPPRSEASR